MSMFYHFRVCRSGDAPTVEKKLNFINSDHCRDFQANYLDWTSDSKSKFLVVGDGAQFDKSLVLLSYRLGVAVEDDDGGYLGEEIPAAVGGPSSPSHLKGSKLII